jgi:hypothetical protein
VTGLTYDGRYAFAVSVDGVRVVDAGAWTVDHGDHKHYYRREPRLLPGRLEGQSPPGAVVSSDDRTAIFHDAAGYATVIDRAALDQGRLTETARVDATPHRGLVVPFAGQYLVTAPDEEGRPSAVEVVAADGIRRQGARRSCPELRGQAVTRAGVVFSCADGALLATATDGRIELDTIRYPDATSDSRAEGLHHRPGSSTLAAVAGGQGAWTLNVRARSWTLVHTDRPLRTAAAVGDDRTLLAVDADGRLRALDARSGQTTAATEPLVTDPEPIRLEIDTSRAYLAAGGVIHEIDYADGLRIARTFRPASRPAFLVETGR